jgi:hypothetical protein
MASPADPETELRVASVLAAAREHSTGVPIDRLIELLPEGAPESAAEFATWLCDRPGLAELGADGRVRPAGVSAGRVPEDRLARAEEFGHAAGWLIEGPLRGLQPLLECVVVTGSVAYGEPEEGDDCDLMLVTRAGALWLVLAWSFVRLRLLGGGDARRPLPSFCLNYVVEEDAAREEFGSARGFLFAREALTVRPVFGEGYYRSLLGTAGWLRAEAPRLYARWSPGPTPERLEAPAPLAARALNALLFPWVAAFLQLKGMYACHGLRLEGEDRRQFHTVTRPKRMALLTLKFERLRATYSPPPATG